MASARVARRDPQDGAVAAPELRRRASSGSFIHAASGILALGLLGFSVAGAVWGALRPTVSAVMLDDGSAVLSSTNDTSFLAWVSFTLGAMVLALALATWAWVGHPECRGVPMLLWVTVVAACSTLSAFAVGCQVAVMIHPTPDITALSAGDTVTLVRSITPGAIAFLLPTWIATLAYWIQAILTRDPELGRGAPDTRSSSAATQPDRAVTNTPDGPVH